MKILGITLLLALVEIFSAQSCSEYGYNKCMRNNDRCNWDGNRCRRRMREY
jgi:hypothetical protein